MRKILIKIVLLSIIPVTSCNNDEEIVKLLNGKDKEDIVLGAYKAGESRNKMYISLLLKDSDDSRRSTNFQFKGITVYQAKMIALKKIYSREPPREITHKTDSLVIKFYTELFQN